MQTDNPEYLARSFDLLERLAMPPLKDKSFLEIGCGNGFFCGYAWFEGAAASYGIAFRKDELEIAHASFPYCAFNMFSGSFAKTISQNEGFDVVLCSAFPEPCDFRSLLLILMSKLKRGGTLIANLSIAVDSEAAERSDKKDPARPIHLTKQELDEILSKYVYKDMGTCAESDRASHIFHIKNRAPYAILLMGESGSGKTTVAKQLFPNLPVIHGDKLMLDLAELEPGSLKNTYPFLDAICCGSANRMSVGGIMIQIFNSAAGKQYACMVASLGSGKDFVYEGVIHPNFQHVFMTQLEKLGYTVLTIGTPPPEQPPNYLFKHARDEARKYCLFLKARRETK